MKRASLSRFAKAASVAINLPRLFAGSPEHGLTTVLFHRFFFPGETLESGRERLRRNIDWLREEYSPVTASQAMDGLGHASLPRFPVLVTVDDVDAEFLKVADIFRSFDVPVILFACVGWADFAAPPDTQTLLARIVALLQWGDSMERDIVVRGLPPIKLGELYRASRTDAIDHIIAARDELNGELGDLAQQLEPGVRVRTCCNWNDLKELSEAGATIGCHSVSHVQLGKASPTRLAFEIEEARKIIHAKFDRCEHFAYPFGNRDSFSAATTAQIKRSGFEDAFLTHADFATGQTDRYHLPRLVIPDDDVSLKGFQAIVRGGGIPLDKAKRLIAKYV